MKRNNQQPNPSVDKSSRPDLKEYSFLPQTIALHKKRSLMEPFLGRNGRQRTLIPLEENLEK